MNILQQYATLKLQVKGLESQLKLMQPDVEKAMDGSQVETEWGKFEIRYRPRWKYSEELSVKEKRILERLKSDKKDEELSGKAEKVSDGGSLTFTAKKG